MCRIPTVKHRLRGHGYPAIRLFGHEIRGSFGEPGFAAQAVLGQFACALTIPVSP